MLSATDSLKGMIMQGVLLSDQQTLMSDSRHEDKHY